MKKFESIRILLIDDMQSWLELVAQSLRLDGYDVTTCSNIEQARESIRKEYFDLVICDIVMDFYPAEGESMGKSGGIFLIQEIKKLSPRTEIVAVTGYGTIDLARTTYNEGIFDFLEKDDKIIDKIKDTIQNIGTKHEQIYLKPQLAGLQYGSTFIKAEKCDLEISIKGSWSVTDFTEFFSALRNIYYFFLMVDEDYLQNIAMNEYNYLEKLWTGINSGMIETKNNQIIIKSINYSSPGKIKIFALGDIIKETNKLINDLVLLRSKLKEANIKNKLKEMEINESKLKQNNMSLDIELKELDVVEKRIDLFKKLELSNDEIRDIILPVTNEINQISKFIDQDKITGSSISAD